MTGYSAAPARRSGMEWATRALFGLLLAGVAVAALFYDPAWFAGWVLLACLLAAREWHRMVYAGQGAVMRPIHTQALITALAIALALVLLLNHLAPVGLAVLAAGTLASFALAMRDGGKGLWHAGGVLYLGLPAMALVGLRAFAPQGLLIVLGLFLIVWATDTGALLSGRMIGGPKLAPRLSPGKTWAGAIGGSICAAVIYGLYLGLLGFAMLPGMALALGLSIVAHGGDLAESAIKRHFGRKDSGSMIPGHGGVLDRIDSTLACSIVLAILVFGAHLNPLFGGHP